MRHIVPLLAAVMLAAACSGSDERAPTTASPAPTVPGLPRGAVPSTSTGTTVPGLYLQHHGHVAGFRQLGGLAGDSALFAVDAATGRPLANPPPIRLSRYANQLTTSPDRTVIAMVVGTGRSPAPIELLELDAAPPPSNAVREPDLALIRWPAGMEGYPSAISDLTWSPDGDHLYWIQRPFWRDNAWTSNQLWRLDASTNTVALLATLEDGDWSSPIVTPVGDTFYLLHRPCCAARGGVSTTMLIAIDAHDGAERDRLDLPDVALTPRDRGGSPAYAPALTLAPDGATLYLAHADIPAITTITTNPLTAATTRLEDPISATTSAEAPRPSAVMKQVEISADGRRLYVSGMRSEGCPNDPFNVCVIDTPLGLDIIDLETMSVARQVPDIGRFTVSPDGRWLAGVATGERWDDIEQAMVEVGPSLTLLDASTGSTAAVFPSSGVTTPDPQGGAIDQLAFDSASSHLHYTSRGASACASCIQLTTINLQRLDEATTHSRGPRPVTLVPLD